MWAALRTAISLMQEGDIQTAQGIVDAAGITVPTGDICEGCYDENGALYRIPQCIASDPSNIVDDTIISGAGDGPDEDIMDVDDDDDDDDDRIADRKIIPEESGDELIPDDLERRREEKGKMSERDMVKVRARLSDRGGPDVTITVGKAQSVGVLVRRIQSEANVCF